ncbi:MAG: ribosome small subunit-dependent GTPase A [Lachnospiraceae bacterium]|nr:ribosome small subunit-dependent GTPase A [Lachnospiraceae bacterium]
MQGRIIKGIAGFYYVKCCDGNIYECKAKGVFRKDHRKPLVGDQVEMDVIDGKEHLGNIAKLLERKNELIRPAVANIDQALVIFAAASPEPNLGLLDRFLIQMEHNGIDTVICFNKEDLVSDEEKKRLARIYESAGYQVLFISAAKKTGIVQIEEVLKGKVTTVAGPSGVGKSTLVNCIQSETVMETGDISAKIERGKHTTRHSQLMEIDEETYIFDTPGFSSLSVSELLPEELKACFPEFAEYEDQCRFLGCAHIHEPDCGVKNALAAGKISRERYEDYVNLYAECKDKRRY